MHCNNADFTHVYTQIQAVLCESFSHDANEITARIQTWISTYIEPLLLLGGILVWMTYGIPIVYGRNYHFYNKDDLRKLFERRRRLFWNIEKRSSLILLLKSHPKKDIKIPINKKIPTNFLNELNFERRKLNTFKNDWSLIVCKNIIDIVVICWLVFLSVLCGAEDDQTSYLFGAANRLLHKRII